MSLLFFLALGEVVQDMVMRSGFTLVEMLAATMIFMVGFVAVYSLFIAGVTYRHDADTVTRVSLANTSLISSLRLSMRDQWTVADTFIGDGHAANGAEQLTDPQENVFFSYADNPGVVYRVHGATDITGQGGAGSENSAGIRLHLYLVNLGYVPPASAPLSFETLWTSQHLTADFLVKYAASLDTASKKLYDALGSDFERKNFILIRRHILHSSHAIILRK